MRDGEDIGGLAAGETPRPDPLRETALRLAGQDGDIALGRGGARHPAPPPESLPGAAGTR